MTDLEKIVSEPTTPYELLLVRMRNRARQMEASATGMMRAAMNARESDDVTGAVREQTIAAREYSWAARLWLDAADGRAAQRCEQLADAVMANQWTEPCLWQVIGFDRDKLTGLVCDGEVTHRFHSTSFQSDSAFRWPREGEVVRVVFSNSGSLLSVHGL